MRDICERFEVDWSRYHIHRWQVGGMPEGLPVFAVLQAHSHRISTDTRDGQQPAGVHCESYQVLHFVASVEKASEGSNHGLKIRPPKRPSILGLAKGLPSPPIFLEFILQHGYAERASSPVRFWDVQTTNQLRSQRFAVQPFGEVLQIRILILTVLLPRHSIDTGCGRPIEIEVVLPRSIKIINVMQESCGS